MAPILAAPLIRRTDAKLIELLESLEQFEWDLPTIVRGWAVRDVAAHLLDTALRKLAMARDACFAERVEIRSARDVADLVNRLNREGVAVYRRLSPALLCELTRTACEQSAEFHESLDPFAPAMFPVSWAGESQSLQWFDTARELTERWHHQQQIRDAVNRPGIMIPELYRPVLETFARALPHSFRDVPAREGARVRLIVEGDCGGQWTIERGPAGWTFDASERPCAATVAIPQQIAWRVFTKGVAPGDAARVSRLEGDREIGERVLETVAIVA